jgi:hypothetical protein
MVKLIILNKELLKVKMWEKYVIGAILFINLA